VRSKAIKKILIKHLDFMYVRTVLIPW